MRLTPDIANIMHNVVLTLLVGSGFNKEALYLIQGLLRGMYHCTVDLLFDWFGISSITTDNFCFYLQNRLIQTSQTGGQQYSDTSPFSIPCLIPFIIGVDGKKGFITFRPLQK